MVVQKWRRLFLTATNNSTTMYLQWYWMRMMDDVGFDKRRRHFWTALLSGQIYLAVLCLAARAGATAVAHRTSTTAAVVHCLLTCLCAGHFVCGNLNFFAVIWISGEHFYLFSVTSQCHPPPMATQLIVMAALYDDHFIFLIITITSSHIAYYTLQSCSIMQ